MYISPVNRRLPQRSQYMWHNGEPFPVPIADIDYILNIYADGDELKFLNKIGLIEIPIDTTRTFMIYPHQTSIVAAYLAGRYPEKKK